MSSHSSVGRWWRCLVIVAISAWAESRGEGDECWGRRIHIRKLPARFNLDLLRNCSQFQPVYPSFCQHLANHGLGPTTHNRTLSWHRTDPSMLEVLFHRRVLDYPCLTPDPLLADAIFLPYYSSLDALPFLFGPAQNSSPLHGLPLFEHLTHHLHRPDLWHRRGGHDHFLVMARPAWDFSQSPHADPLIWGTSFLRLPQFYNLSALIVESRPTPYQEQAIPYPTSFHPPTPHLLRSWIRRVRRSPRTTLMLFAGGGGSIGSNPNIRRSIRLECTNLTASASAAAVDYVDYSKKICEFVDCSAGACEHDPIRYMRPMLEADFCLQPPGDTPTRRSAFDSFLAGCIPVFFEDLSARRQYGWHLPEDEYGGFSVTIPKEEVVWDGLRIGEVLRRIPEEEVRRMRERVIDLMPRLIYRKHGGSPLGWAGIKDAFDIAVEGVLERIRNRLLKFNYSA